MTHEEKLDRDATALVDLWACIWTKINKQCTGIPAKDIMTVSIALATAEISKNGAHL